jgi:hypothetical protein
MSSRPPEPLPPYTYVPGGPWPHPTRSPEGHRSGNQDPPALPIRDDAWEASAFYLRGIELFNAGYYWEAHEAWESLWHAHGRRGPTAEILQALIKLAAAGVKVREGRPAGVRTHAARAADLFERARRGGGAYQLGLDLAGWAHRALLLSAHPPTDPAPSGARVSRVFDFTIEPQPLSSSAGQANSLAKEVDR